MSTQLSLLSKPALKEDIVYTPEPVAKKIIDLVNPKGTLLDPCRGGGAFYDNFPSDCSKDYCEIEEGKDFLDYNKKVDYIITNPPYSIYDDFIRHSYMLADNIVFLVPINKVFGSGRRIKEQEEYGGIKAIGIFSRTQTEFPFGFACGAVWMQKGYVGKTEIRRIDDKEIGELCKNDLS